MGRTDRVALSLVSLAFSVCFLAALAISLTAVHAVWSMPPPPEKWLPHRYIGTVAVGNVYTGDSFYAEITTDFGLNIYSRIRLAGISAPSPHGTEKEAGQAARDALANLIVGQPLYIEVQVTRAGKPIRSFDRTVARVWLERDGQLQDVAGLLIHAGHGVATNVREISP